MPALIRSVLRSARQRVVDFFVFGPEDARDKPPISAHVLGWSEAARRRLKAVHSLRAGTAKVAALSLYREAALLLVRAACVAKGASFDAASGLRRPVLDELDEALASLGEPLPKELVRHRSLLVDSDATAVDRLSSAEVSIALGDLDQATQWLLGLVETRSRRQRWLGRVIPFSLAVLVVLGSAGVVLARLYPEKNLALKKKVSSSSTAWQTAPEGAVDGFRYGQLGFHSAEQKSAWLAVDLGRDYSITRVEAYARGDCCHDQSLPLALEFSDDGVSYRRVASRTLRFSVYEPWVIDANEQVARFVRFRTLAKTPLVLAEVEVYASEAPTTTGDLQLGD
jgi:hypothetical protein